MDLSGLEQVSNRIVQSCSRDAIQSGKNFVFTPSLDEKQMEAICCYIKQRIQNNETNSEARLHLVYFMNELLNHAHKNKIDLVKKQMEKIVIPCFCLTAQNIDAEKASKIDKLLDIWEKTKYFSSFILDKLKRPDEGLAYYEETLKEEKAQIAQKIEQDYSNQFKQFECQHKDFVNHSNSQITKFQTQIAQMQGNKKLIVNGNCKGFLPYEKLK